MSLPGEKVNEGSAPVSSTLPSEGDALFLGITSERGRTDTWGLARSLAEFVSLYGQRITSSLAYDYLDYYFRQGGARAYLGRYVGAAAVKATVTLTDVSGSAIVFTAVAKAPGVWYNGLNVIVTVNAGTFNIQITHDTDLTINESSGFLPDNTSLQAWASQNSQLIDLVPGAAIANPLVAQNKNMGATVVGADDTAGITDTTAKAALDLFPKDLGPGQVAWAQRTSAVAQGQLLDHGAANQRWALPDPPDTAVKATLISAAAALRSHINASWGAMYAPWLQMDGLVPNTFRDIPPSAAVAAIRARNSLRGVSPGQAPMGKFGILDQARLLKATFMVDQDRDDLNEASVNLIRSIGQQIKIYGARSLVNPLTNPNWFQATSRVIYITAAARGDAILEDFVGNQIDGQNIVFSQLQNRLITMMDELYTEGALFGATAASAYAVDTGESVNTPQTIKAGLIKARVSGVFSPTGETVRMELVKQMVQG